MDRHGTVGRLGAAMAAAVLVAGCSSGGTGAAPTTASTTTTSAMTPTTSAATVPVVTTTITTTASPTTRPVTTTIAPRPLPPTTVWRLVELGESTDVGGSAAGASADGRVWFWRQLADSSFHTYVRDPSAETREITPDWVGGTTVSAVSPDGWAVGMAYSAEGPAAGVVGVVVWAPDEVAVRPTLGGSVPEDVAPGGWVLFDRGEEAMLWHPGGTATRTGLRGGGVPFGAQVNALGWVAGRRLVDGRAVLLRPGERDIDLGWAGPGTSTDCWPDDLDDEGTVVGYCAVPDPVHPGGALEWYRWRLGEEPAFLGTIPDQRLAPLQLLGDGSVAGGGHVWLPDGSERIVGSGATTMGAGAWVVVGDLFFRDRPWRIVHLLADGVETFRLGDALLVSSVSPEGIALGTARSDATSGGVAAAWLPVATC